MTPIRRLIPVAVTALGLLTACSGDLTSPFSNDNLTTSAVAPPPAPIVNPSCVALNSRIDSLRREGVADRAAQAATGKTATVQIQRSSLAKLAELDKANAEFQAKCSALGPRTASLGSSAPANVAAGSAPVPLTPPPLASTASPAAAVAAPRPRVVQETQRTGLESTD